MRLNFDTDWFNNNKWVKVAVQVRTTSSSPSENSYLFLNVMVNFVIVNQKLTGSALHIKKNQTISVVKILKIAAFSPLVLLSNIFEKIKYAQKKEILRNFQYKKAHADPLRRYQNFLP